MNTAITLLIELLILFFVLALLVWAVSEIFAIYHAAPFVASGKQITEKMLDLGGVSNGKKILELGSGDGEVCIQAAERGASAIGIELNPVLVLFARFRARRRGVGKHCVFIRGNFWKQTFPADTDVVLFYLLPQILTKLWKKLERELRPGTIIISHAFKFPDREPEARDGKVLRYRL
ncbi:methyltransferase domain-containing protein [Patescibacteria group bacterium]|nr:methyltransferase domain-containing protein [Patescibacteria group bacterium]MBU1908171.1 methyltransferase domain-containing protein [Patescibacteria group bacterium]